MDTYHFECAAEGSIGTKFLGVLFSIFLGIVARIDTGPYTPTDS